MHGHHCPFIEEPAKRQADYIVDTVVSDAVKQAVDRVKHQRTTHKDGSPGGTMGELYREAKLTAVDDDFWSEVDVWVNVLSPIV